MCLLEVAGLLDGGATHALRMAQPGSPPGHLGWDCPVAGIVLLVDLLGCRVACKCGQCAVIHPYRGDLGVWLEDNCPVVSGTDCLRLIREIEQFRAGRLQQALQVRAPSLEVNPKLDSVESSLWGSDKELTV